MSRRSLILIGIAVIILPFLLNLLVINHPPFNFIEVNDDNDWIGFFSSYAGAILGGLFTFIGVRLTIKDQEKSRKEQLNIDSRPQIHISEIYNATYDLGNVSADVKKSGRLIITEYYRLAERLNYRDECHFNFIVIDNLGTGSAINCEISIDLRYEDNNEVLNHEIFLPILNIDERIFIPVDPVPSTREYRIIRAQIKYQSVTAEKLQVERNYQKINSDYIVKDIYYLMNQEGHYQEMFNVRGSKAEWKYI